jgi:hypothetical protein
MSPSDATEELILNRGRRQISIHPAHSGVCCGHIVFAGRFGLPPFE